MFNNPHNGYLMIRQTGIFRLALLLYIFYTQWQYAPLLDSPLLDHDREFVTCFDECNIFCQPEGANQKHG